ncbi:MAG: hypothetical protein ACLU3U_10420 [Gallintestinimicrobium sp.]
MHQNSYPDPAIKGSTGFYYTSSVEGKQLAKRLQERLSKEDLTRRTIGRKRRMTATIF